MKIVALEYLVDIQVAQGFIIYAQFLGNDVVMDDILYEACSIDITQSGTTNQIKLVNIVVLYSISLVVFIRYLDVRKRSHMGRLDGNYSMLCSPTIRNSYRRTNPSARIFFEACDTNMNIVRLRMHTYHS